MPTLPSGTVTFLFTDIEGSTAFWERNRSAMAAVVDRHLVILRRVVEAHGGTLFKVIGDATQSAFPTVPRAVAAAVEAQRALGREPWPDETGSLLVRMALHAGEADPVGGDYLAPSLNRLSRLLAAGHGGQILLTLTAADLTRDALPAGAALRDLGEHQLRDLHRSERVWQLLHPDLPVTFPRLKSMALGRHNLPAQPTPFIGREREVAQVVELLRRDEVRLLTLTGPGGIGKTRLAIHAAAELAEDFADGVWFVDLAPLADPDLVPSAIAVVLGVRETGGGPLVAALQEYLREKRLLLLPDNLEHLLTASALLADLIRECPRLKVLATSRAPLHLGGEREVPVPSLTVPDSEHLPDLEQLMLYESMRLFVARAQDARPDFAITAEIAPVIAQICARLDGLPLAIALAAARIRLLPPQALLARLEVRLPLLSGGARDAPARQRTLRDEIAWSHDLLSADQQALFRRLAAFAGGCTLEAAEAAVDHADGFDVLAGLDSLVDSSLMNQNERDGEPRFAMLETIREYGLERLSASGEEAAVRKCLATYFQAVVEVAERKLTGPAQVKWLERLEAEHANLRAVLGRAFEHDVATGVRLAGGLYRFWRYRAYFTEGRSWLERAVAEGPAGPSRDRAKALIGAGSLARQQSDLDRAAALHEESLALYRNLGDMDGVVTSLVGLGNVARERGDMNRAAAVLEEALGLSREVEDTHVLANALDSMGLVSWDRGDLGRGKELQEESLALNRKLGDAWNIARLLNNLGDLAYERGDLDWAAATLEEAMSLWEGMGDTHGVAYVLDNLGLVARGRGSLDQAAALFDEALVLWRQLGDKRNVAVSLKNLARVTQERGIIGEAAALLNEALTLSHEAGDMLNIASALEGAADMAVMARQPNRAARLLGASAALRESLGAPIPASEQAVFDRAVAAARAALGEESFEAARKAGGALTVEAALAEALALTDELSRDRS